MWYNKYVIKREKKRGKQEMCVDLECPICKKITQGMLFDDWWETDEKFARKYYSIQCMECDTVVDFEEEYKVALELQNTKKECRIENEN